VPFGAILRDRHGYLRRFCMKKFWQICCIEGQAGYISLKTGFILLLFTMAVFPFVVNLSVNLPKVLQFVESVQEDEAIALLRESGFCLDKKIVQRQESLRLLAGVPGARDILSHNFSKFSESTVRGRLAGLINMWFSGQPDVIEIALYDLQSNKVFCMERQDTGALVLHDTGDSSPEKEILSAITTFRDLKDFSRFVSFVEQPHKHGKNHQDNRALLVKIAIPVRDYAGHLSGIGCIAVDLVNVLNGKAFDFLATGSGLFIKLPGLDCKDYLFQAGELFKVFPAMKAGVRNSRHVVSKDRQGRKVVWFSLFANVQPEQNLWAGQTVDPSMAKAFRDMLLSRIAVVSGMALMLILFLVWRCSSLMDRYRLEFMDTLHSVLLGQANTRLQWQGPPEIERLAHDMNELLDKFVENDMKRREALKKLEDLSRRMTLVLDSAAEGIVEINMQHEIIFVNQAACRMFGFRREDIIGSDLHSIFHYMREDRSQYPKEECLFCKALSEGRYNLFREEVFWRKDGQPISVEYVTAAIRNENDTVTGIVMCIRDVTARKAAEEKASMFQDQLRQAQKMQTLGILAGGIAHDFNNLLTAIRGYSQLLELDLAEDSEARRRLQGIQQASDRAAALVRQLLVFSRKQPAQKRVIDLCELLHDQEKMLRRIIGEDISFKVCPCTAKALVMADPNMIAQVIMNMVINSRDALEGRVQKHIEIKVENLRLSAEDVSEMPGRRSGDFVMLSVRDTGSGIDPDIISNIFDPFFTTKDIDKGTGLGLSVAFGIVQQHDGWIECCSKPGAGSLFNIFLPAYTGEAVPAAGSAVIDHVPERYALTEKIGRELTVLVLEDDPLVLNITREMLKTFGFDVLSSSNIQEANYLMNRIGKDIDLLISDVVLPDGNGMEFVEQVMGRWPTMSVLLLSGYVDREEHVNRIREQDIPFLSKPFRMDDLYEAVLSVLNV